MCAGAPERTKMFGSIVGTHHNKVVSKSSRIIKLERWMFNEGELETGDLSHEYSVNQDVKVVFSYRSALSWGCVYIDLRESSLSFSEFRQTRLLACPYSR